jgi:hypothetical protein
MKNASGMKVLENSFAVLGGGQYTAHHQGGWISAAEQHARRAVRPGMPMEFFDTLKDRREGA